MHEMSLVKSIIETALRVSREHGNLPIEEIHIAIGALRQVEPSALEFAFGAAREGTDASNAVLIWNVVPARIECGHCHHEYTPNDDLWICPVCESTGGRVIEGNELILKTIVVEDPAMEG